MMSLPTEALADKILFDQFSRYRAVAEFLRAAAPAGATVLDCGSGEACLLGRFLSDLSITYADPLLAGTITRRPHQLAIDVFDATLDNRRFDFVVAVDTLEHIPPAKRDAFLQRVISLSTRGVLIAGPCADVGDALATDHAVNEAYMSLYGNRYHWLDEHFQFGLPRYSDLDSFFRERGWHTHFRDNGHTPWLRPLLTFAIAGVGVEGIARVVRDVSTRFNQQLAQYDHRPPSYRRLLLATRDPISLANGPAPLDASITEGTDREWESLLETIILAAARGAMQLKEVDQLQHDIDMLRSSRSWQLTAPLRTLVDIGIATRDGGPGILDRLQAGFACMPLSPRGREILRDLFFTIFGPLLRGTPHHDHFLRERNWRRQSGHTLESAPLGPPLRAADRADVIIFGVIDWEFRIQRPQHLALELARAGHRVFFVSPAFAESTDHGFEAAPADAEGLVHIVRLRLPRRVSIYAGLPTPAVSDTLRRGLSRMIRWSRTTSAICIVEHPFWSSLADLVPNSRLVYDCMDHHAGFANTAPALIQSEKELLQHAELVVASAESLAQQAKENNPQVALIRNATEYDHFARTPDTIYADPAGRPIVGYYGAISDWFDVDLIDHLAEQMPEVSILLVGADTVRAAARLAGRVNVRFIGEVAYDRLPHFLHAMSVCLLPFRISPLTLATNPVKVYEYLSAGKSVVAVRLPELEHMRPHVCLANSSEEFVTSVRDNLQNIHDSGAIGARQSFARANTWKDRVDRLRAAIAAIPDPAVSIVIVTYGQLDRTRQCLASIEQESDDGNLEIIVVDNASTDGTPEFLTAWAAAGSRRHVLRNSTNRGFPAAVNQGLAAATGEYLALLNNDTVVTRGWIRTLIRHLRRDLRIGLIGPVTNNIGNEARVTTSYTNLDAMAVEAQARSAEHLGGLLDLPMVAFFCVMMRREMHERVGPLDEAFGIGYFEDDDYCRRVEQLGFRIVCAEDVFVHHDHSASFDALALARKKEIFEASRRHYESKWGPWVPHQYRR